MLSRKVPNFRRPLVERLRGIRVQPPEGGLEIPILLQCDSLGRVLWMSRPARQADAASPAICWIRYAIGYSGIGPRISPRCHFWPVLELPDSVVIGAQVTEQETGGNPRTARYSTAAQRSLSPTSGLRAAPVRRGAAAPRAGAFAGAAVGRSSWNASVWGANCIPASANCSPQSVCNWKSIALELPAPPDKVRQALDSISTLAADTLEQVRAISRRLHPPEWQRLTLESAVRQFWSVSGIPQRFEAELRIDAGSGGARVGC